MKQIIMISMMLFMVGCASLNPLDIIKEKPGIEVNAAVGKNVEQEKSLVKMDSGKDIKQEAETISNDTKYKADTIEQITNQMPPWMFFVVIFLAGWAIPDPKVCFGATKNVICEITVGVGKALSAPFRGIANFILLLFNREKM